MKGFDLAKARERCAHLPDRSKEIIPRRENLAYYKKFYQAGRMLPAAIEHIQEQAKRIEELETEAKERQALVEKYGKRVMVLEGVNVDLNSKIIPMRKEIAALQARQKELQDALIEETAWCLLLASPRSKHSCPGDEERQQAREDLQQRGLL